MSIQFGMQLKQLRKQQKLSQTQLGKAVGIHYNHVGLYERGDSFPSGPVLIRLANALGVSIDRLVKGDSVQPEPAFDKPSSGLDDDSKDSKRNEYSGKSPNQLVDLIYAAERLPLEDQAVLAKVIEAFIQKNTEEHRKD